MSVIINRKKRNSSGSLKGKDNKMKNLKKIVGIIAMFIGLTALYAVDSDVPLWGTIIIVLVGIIGVAK